LRTVRYVGWAGAALNLALIAATPTVGAHYFIDIAGGVVVALAAIAAAHVLCRGAKADDLSIASASTSDLPESAQARI